ncbi:NAD-dependent epimerase/dehydratase family protein [Flavobacterium sp. SUN052]|uniref:NAD-dependent epimerase/dehydratase family protein n=1 Tax=Flavobacterium sp. SUN052 TaxID=3002441 RepID=UPI00237D83B1|nr:NAD-dependent epimerase/dehydratase family protein [Flavobacterium sp. SUN052]MEC4004055.1 NAD-dependent epimerase/dehydratase family protein [Flavobacterium sp. SUN052]
MILVTGGTGLVGAHLLLHLTENNEENIRAIYRNSKNIEKTKSLFELYKKSELFSKIEWIKADILDVPSLEIAFENVNYVYHCAAFISFNPDDENTLRKINIEGTANIVNFCIDKNITKLCHVSSVAALGDLSQNQTIITEETEWNPEVSHSDYAISKYGAEMEVWRGHQEGLEVVIVNPGVILGPGFWNQGSGAFLSSIKKGFPFYTNGSTGYISVIDVVKIMSALMHSNCNGERFTLISENRSYKDMIYTIAVKIGAKKPKIEAKPWLLNLAWRLDWLFSNILRTKRKISKNSVQSLLNKDEISNEKIKSQLNYSFTPIDDYLNTIAFYFNT